jgi:hypothetical protein
MPLNVYRESVLINEYCCTDSRGEWAIHESELVSLAPDHEVPKCFVPQATRSLGADPSVDL